MRRIPLGRTDKTITDYCLGTMTWGNQTPEQDAHRQMDMALDAGIDIVDTAEMYPVNPVRAETVGLTETILGNWNAANPGRRDSYVLATKITGKNKAFVRPDQDITAETFAEALDASLSRLRTDHIDIYQLHWPNRGSYHFRQNWGYDPSAQDKSATLANMVEVLQAAKAAQQAGKIGHFALSNESAWGTAQWLQLAQQHDLPRVETIQNEYSLLCRLYDTDLAELAVNEQVTLLAYSPLAAGLLTGKYQGGAVPIGSRMKGNGDLGGRATARAFAAVDAYLEVAQKHGLDPVHMALAFTVQRPFAVSTIFGATTSDQLQRILDGVHVTLSEDVLTDLDTTHRAHPMPY
ncbi:Oxidoreductase, aldo/keto reductase family [Roseibacterium elongatum DSM 19469]|uniref:Oxidoreductase, aldo/keto reductase family n=1 Tax=Roseicyclus elongatus DSM 19469 TaxID=1294273 RepID=W8RNE2_9RHOB|nr:aldo/keto reductase [Roseibacterium elongatum]AHM02518.1 Oxidoreductase, aldo/keto reductase family [Roseibacterium elongatum DSM 19469]